MAAKIPERNCFLVSFSEYLLLPDGSYSMPLDEENKVNASLSFSMQSSNPMNGCHTTQSL